jgi:tripartite-type tricarboxylate transporter receptor subunit TctC
MRALIFPFAMLPTMPPLFPAPALFSDNTLSRRTLLRAGLACGLGGLGAAAQAQSAKPAWPQRPIQMIVPWPAGGATDLTLRILNEEAEPLLGQRVVVVNRPGAAGTLVAPQLKAAEPDGYTIGQIPLTVYRHALMNHVPWNPVSDLAPILQISGTTFGLLVPAASAWKSLADLLAWARQHPGELTMGSTGIGTTAHLAMEEILLANGITYVHVPYKGTTEQMLAVASGQLMAGVNSTGFAPWLEQGKMRLLAIFSGARSGRWPQVPTMRELGYERSVYTSPWGLAAPRGTPTAIVQLLHNAFRQAAFSPRHRTALARYDQDISYLDTSAYQQAILDTVAREKALLARMKLLASPA